MPACSIFFSAAPSIIRYMVDRDTSNGSGEFCDSVPVSGAVLVSVVGFVPAWSVSLLN